MKADLVPDILPQGLDIVFCGTALGRESYRQRAYYAHPGNLFWRTLHETGLTPRRLAPQEYPILPQFGVGVTDLCKRNFGNDDELSEQDFDIPGTWRKIEACQPRVVAFTSKNSGRLFLRKKLKDVAYGLQGETVGGTAIFVLPSPSGQGRRYWDSIYWQQAADHARNNGNS